ncbi:MAG TPA: ABC transporter ATP-binding protein [Methylomirabilota bacterium]|jgi:branched-chain amino acid transport system ATP-binding protein|nr:ABC transporter ATP-binding protein [Methylomirabilota bacterium]
MSALTVSGLAVSYGAVAALHDVSLEVRQGEIVSVIGGNGAGKTTLLKAIAGVLRPAAGRIAADGRDIAGRPSWWVARHGISLVPEGRGIFGDQSVHDNLVLGASARRGTVSAADLERALSLFPALAAKLGSPAASLSGGQQQMLAVARGLMARPRVLLLDEPSLGLAPMLAREVFAAIQRLRADGVTILLVEQMAVQALALADRAYVLERGRVILEGSAQTVRENPAVIDAYLGRRV